MSCILGTGRVDTELMTAATKIERCGPAIRAALTELAPAEGKEFEAEFRQGTSLTVVSSDAPRAHRIVAGPLRSVDAA